MKGSSPPPSSPEGFFPFFPYKRFFSDFLAVFPDVRSKVRDVICIQIVKPSEDNLTFLILGCTEMTELN